MQKTRRLMDENSVSFQMFLILLFLIFIALGSEKPNFCIQAMSKQYSDVWVFFKIWGGGSMRTSRFCSEKNAYGRHFVRFNFSRLSLAFIVKYYPTCMW